MLGRTAILLLELLRAEDNAQLVAHEASIHEFWHEAGPSESRRTNKLIAQFLSSTCHTQQRGISRLQVQSSTWGPQSCQSHNAGIAVACPEPSS
jgi:hypothetical protein